MAIESPLPLYPTESVESKKAGLVVVDVVVGLEGSVNQIKILQAPDDAISREVRQTITRWKFRNENKMSLQSRLMFEFSLNADSPAVFDRVLERP